MTASIALKTRVAVGRPRLATAGFTTSVRMCLQMMMVRRTRRKRKTMLRMRM